MPELMVEVLICTSIDGAEVDSPEGNRGGIYLDAGFSGLNVDDGGGCEFQGVLRFWCGFFVVNLWWVDGGSW
jgi:hypothetical protein